MEEFAHIFSATDIYSDFLQNILPKRQKPQRNPQLDAFFVDNNPPAQYIHTTSCYIHKLNVPIENFRNLFYMF
jgi:hypothetical protein